jgi:hypothetical protein
MLISQQDMSGPRLGTLSKNRWSGNMWALAVDGQEENFPWLIVRTASQTALSPKVKGIPANSRQTPVPRLQLRLHTPVCWSIPAVSTLLFVVSLTPLSVMGPRGIIISSSHRLHHAHPLLHFIDHRSSLNRFRNNRFSLSFWVRVMIVGWEGLRVQEL